GADLPGRADRVEASLPPGQRQGESPGAGDPALPQRQAALKERRRPRRGFADGAVVKGDRAMTMREICVHEIAAMQTRRALGHAQHDEHVWAWINALMRVWSETQPLIHKKSV